MKDLFSKLEAAGIVLVLFSFPIAYTMQNELQADFYFTALFMPFIFSTGYVIKLRFQLKALLTGKRMDDCSFIWKERESCCV